MERILVSILKINPAKAGIYFLQSHILFYKVYRRHSLYNYAVNNPIKFTDSDGRSIRDFNGGGSHMIYDGNHAGSMLSFLQGMSSGYRNSSFSFFNSSHIDANGFSGGGGDSSLSPWMQANIGGRFGLENNVKQNCCSDSKLKIEVKLDMFSQSHINYAFVQNNSEETVYYLSEEGSDKQSLYSKGTIHEKVDGIRVGNTVIKISDGYRSVIIDNKGNVNIMYDNPFSYGYYLYKGGVLKSSPGANWDPLFNKK